MNMVKERDRIRNECKKNWIHLTSYFQMKVTSGIALAVALIDSLYSSGIEYALARVPNDMRTVRGRRERMDDHV